MTGAKKLVIGASGFLGSDVTQQLFDRGDDIARASRRCAMRCATAATSSTVSSTQGRGCATPRRCFAPMSKACGTCWTRRWTPIYGVSPSPAPSAYPPTAPRHFQLKSRSVRLMHVWPTLDDGKAEREPGWQPSRSTSDPPGRPVLSGESTARQKQVVDYACLLQTSDSRSTCGRRILAEPARSIRRSPR